MNHLEFIDFGGYSGVGTEDGSSTKVKPKAELRYYLPKLMVSQMQRY